MTQNAANQPRRAYESGEWAFMCKGYRQAGVNESQLLYPIFNKCEAFLYFRRRDMRIVLGLV